MRVKSSGPLIVGNWKMYKTLAEAMDFIKATRDAARDSQADVRLAVPYTLIRETSELAGDGPFTIGGQNMNDASEGAFTGEVSGEMLLDAGAKFVILGHSERRGYYNETDEFINRKVHRALKDGLEIILCVGESNEDHSEGRIKEKLEAQLLGSLEGVKPEDFEYIAIAYEPVWAIGTGKPATSEEVSEESKIIRGIIADKWGKTVADELTLLYGGSVNDENAQNYLSKKNIDGLLIGSASLNSDTFVNIISKK
ncbi:MAG: triose-phosphate isomerase [Chlamydiia bacterium]|nr:triose-phosphate isomerase [Chlamydiia bacterium]